MRNFSKLLVSVVGVSKAEAAPIAAVLQAVINVVVVMIMVVVVVVVVIVVNNYILCEWRKGKCWPTT